MGALYSIRSGPSLTSFGLALFLTGVTACHAQVRQAQVNPVPVRLPIDHATDIRFAHISTAQGLSQIRVTSIVQDNQGFMWFGTLYGLNRFDGYTFKVYMHERGNSNSMSGVDVVALFKDRDGFMWVGCEQALDRFDPQTETFTHFAVQKVKQISQDRAGLLWLSTDNGLYRLDPASGQIRRYAHDPSDPESLPDNYVVAAYEDRSGRFWVGEPHGMYELDPTTGHIKLSIPLHTGARDLSFYEDKEGKFWIMYGTGNGLAQFDRKRNVLTYFSFRDGDLGSTGYSGVAGMLEDNHGNLWLAKQEFGLLKLDREHNRFIGYVNVPGDSGSLKENNIIALFEDRGGSIWLSLPDEGLARFSPVLEAFQPLSPDQKGAHAFYEDSHQNLWIGTTSTLIRFDPSGKRTASFEAMDAGVPFDILSIVEDRSGLIWVGTSNHGLFRLEPQSGRWKSYRHKDGDPSSLSNNVVHRLLVGQDGTLWAVTWDGLDRFDARTDRFTTFKANPNAREQIYFAAAEDAQHMLWLGSLGSGLQQLDPSTGQFTTYIGGDTFGSLSNSEVNSVHIAHTGKVWAATSNGLNEFDPATKQFTVYGLDEGIASSFVDCMLEDARGKLWMSTSKGISSFDPSTKGFRNFSTADGLPGPEMVGADGCFKAASGRMYFVGLSGATTFLPEAIPDNISAPPTVITDFRVLGSQHSLRGNITRPAISYASEVTLSHKETPFSLTFAALSYSNSPANRYRYKLENLDNSWAEVGSDSRTVTYSALAAGKYRFRVQGATNSSRWSEPGAELQIIILPPWWSTWWFRIAYATAALLAIWFFYRYRMRQIAEQSKIRILAQVDERMRIARELHDTLLQDFQAIILRFDGVFRRLVGGDPNKLAMDEGLRFADKVLREGRDRIRDIRADTKEPQDLSKAFADYGSELSQLRPVAFEVKVTGTQTEIDSIVRDEIYRIGREAIGNAFKHSECAKVDIELAYDPGEFRMRIQDDGKGIDPAIVSAGGKPGHWGIYNMRERAQKIGATLEFLSHPSAGTTLTLKLPHGSFKESLASLFPWRHKRISVANRN